MRCTSARYGDVDMNEIQREKLVAELTLIEGGLRGRLEILLPSVVDTGASLFFNSAHHPVAWCVHWCHADAETLLELAQRAVALRERLGEHDADSPGSLYLTACAEACEESEEQGLGPRRLAARLLEALRNPRSS